MSERMKAYLSIAAMFAMNGFFYFLTPSEEMASGGAIFPSVLMGLLLALTVLTLALNIYSPKSNEAPQDDDPGAKVNRPRFWFILGAIIVYVLSVDYIGFYVSSFIFFFGLTVAVQYEKRTPRGLLIRLASVTGFMVFLYVLFTKILLAQLPKGIFF